MDPRRRRGGGPFVLNRRLMEALDSIARRYSTLPSNVIGETDPLKAMSINLRAHNAGANRERYQKWLRSNG